MDSGDARWDLLGLIVILIVLGVAWVWAGGPNRPEATGGSFIYAPYDTKAIENDTANRGDSIGMDRTDDDSYTVGANLSTWGEKISLERGTAARADRAEEEYVVIRNRGREAVTISGWSLKNGADAQVSRTASGDYVAPRSKWVVIPNGVKTYYPGQANSLKPITLSPGEQAIITSGRILDSRPYVINASFQTNICTGYLSEVGTYQFFPNLRSQCPDPEDEPGVSSLLDTCREVVEDLSRCETPVVKQGGDVINGYTNLSASCRKFIIDHFSYAGCLKYHAGDTNFTPRGSEWRVYLNQGELWRESNEMISLYDNQGRLVDRVSY